MICRRRRPRSNASGDLTALAAAGALPDELGKTRLIEISLRGVDILVRHANRWKKESGMDLFTFASHWHAGETTALLVGGSMDAANILKPALARGAIRLIGATTCSVIL